VSNDRDPVSAELFCGQFCSTFVILDAVTFVVVFFFFCDPVSSAWGCGVCAGRPRRLPAESEVTDGCGANSCAES